MCTTDKIFDNIYLKAIEDTFCQYVVGNQVRDGVKHKGKEKDSNFCWRESELTLDLPLVANPDLHKMYSEEGSWCDYCNNIEKSEYCPSKQQTYSM